MTEQCVICLENMEGNENILTLECSHTYHKECINDWLDRAQTCPMCRQKVEPENTIRDLAINRYMRKLKLVQLVALTDVVTSTSMMFQNAGIVDFICSLWGYWGSYRLNINYLILYGISRIVTSGIMGYRLVIYVKNDIQRMYDLYVTIYGIIAVFYMYIVYIIIILSLDMHKYKEDVLPLLSN